RERVWVAPQSAERREIHSGNRRWFSRREPSGFSCKGRSLPHEGCCAKANSRHARNRERVRLAKATSDSITGTSTSTPTTVASAAPEFRPNRLMATATASSKKFEVPIRAQGAAILCGTRHAQAAA